ncbi:MAG TPA: BTAD domain-containing putative transcriptional regulator, partial [Acidimicrobiales bacterium]
MRAEGEPGEVQFRVLGPVEVRRHDELVNLGGAQQRRLLAALLTESGTVVPLDRMVDVVWADGDAPDGARRSLMTYVSRLRASLGDGYVTTQEPGYLLDPGAGSLDADRFERLVDQARSAAPTESIALLDQALALWHGPAFGEFGAEWWARPAAVRLDELRLVAAEERAEAQLSSRQHERAVSDLEALVAAYPLRERLVGQLMRALNASGRQAEALRAFSTFRAYLAEETGLEPSESLVALDREIAGGGTATPAPDGQLSVRGYVLGESLGEGAFGSVYRAVQPGVGREVAVKVIRAEFADDPVFVQRFEAEAQLVARLEHPHIVPLYDFWREPGGAFLVFRLLRGGTAERSLVVDGPWTLERVTQLVDEVGGALMAAHAAGVIHRDVKPANVLFDDGGSSYLADFGISVTEGVHGLGAGYSAGSPVYAGPEQFHGDAATPENDVYGLAVTVWELLAGHPPFEGASAAEILRVKMTEPLGSLRALRPDVPDVVEAVLQRATAVRTKDRYPSAAEFVLAWQSAVGRAGATGTTGVRASALPATPRAEAARTMAHLQAGLTNPYKGLRPFGEADARDFHGRADLVDALTVMAEGAAFVAVVGPSGSGKSSLVHAGVVPRLRESGCRVVTMVPAAAPLGQLRTALLAVATRPVPDGDVTEMVGVVARDGGGDLVVVVDQFEEAWTLAEPEERERFLDGLAAVAAGSDGGRVIVTIRADFFDRPLAHPAIGPLVSAHTFSVTPMTSAELLDAIHLPALALGVTFDAGLDTQLVAEVVSQPASLPLLQFALAELYDQRTGSVVTAAAYRQMGGVAGAIAARAEQVYGQLDREQQQATRRLFTRLVTPGDDAPDTRRRARRSELPAAVLEVVDQLGAHRLLTFDHDPVTREPTVEVAHESLLRSWPRLQQWIDEDRDWLRQLGHLSGAAASWDDRGREPADLYAGSRLAAATEALDARGDALSPLEHDFVTASRDHAVAAERHDRLTRHRLQRLLLVTGVLLVIALIGGAVAVRQGQSAERNRTGAQLEALANRSTALRGTQRDVAALLAVEAHRLRPDDNSNSALLAALTQSPGFLGYTRVPDVIDYLSGTVLAGGTTAVIQTDTGQLARVDLTTGSIDHPYPATTPAKVEWSFVRSSGDARLLAVMTDIKNPSGDDVSTVRVLDADTGALVSGPIDFDFAVG